MLELLALYALGALACANVIILLDYFDVIIIADADDAVTPSIVWPALAVVTVAKGVCWVRDRIANARLF